MHFNMYGLEFEPQTPHLFILKDEFYQLGYLTKKSSTSFSKNNSTFLKLKKKNLAQCANLTIGFAKGDKVRG